MSIIAHIRTYKVFLQEHFSDFATLPALDLSQLVQSFFCSSSCHRA
jgi:hypothetical protein